jgi:hypothetical protein
MRERFVSQELTTVIRNGDAVVTRQYQISRLCTRGQEIDTPHGNTVF